MGIPRSCCDCQFERCCNSAMNMDGCMFYGTKVEKPSMVSRIKEFFRSFIH